MGRILSTLQLQFLLISKHDKAREPNLEIEEVKMSIHKYTNAFIDKTEFALYIVLDELEKVSRYVKGVKWQYYVSVHLEPTLEVAIWVPKSVET